MRNLLFILLGLVLLAAAVGCKTTQEATNLAIIDLDFTWDGTAKCFDPQSPPFTVANVPAGAESLRFRMIDLDSPSYPHGGGTVAYAGRADVPRGAFEYKGPCPPYGSHRYQWTVEALGKGGSLVLGRGTTTKKFPPEK